MLRVVNNMWTFVNFGMVGAWCACGLEQWWENPLLVNPNNGGSIATCLCVHLLVCVHVSWTLLAEANVCNGTLVGRGMDTNPSAWIGGSVGVFGMSTHAEMGSQVGVLSYK